jgi:hypothetical protein
MSSIAANLGGQVGLSNRPRGGLRVRYSQRSAVAHPLPAAGHGRP